MMEVRPHFIIVGLTGKIDHAGGGGIHERFMCVVVDPFRIFESKRQKAFLNQCRGQVDRSIISYIQPLSFSISSPLLVLDTAHGHDDSRPTLVFQCRNLASWLLCSLIRRDHWLSSRGLPPLGQNCHIKSRGVAKSSLRSACPVL